MKPTWKPIADENIRLIFVNDDGSCGITVSPSELAEIGTPICTDTNSEFFDQEMVYARTEILA